MVHVYNRNGLQREKAREGGESGARETPQLRDTARRPCPVPAVNSCKLAVATWHRTQEVSQCTTAVSTLPAAGAGRTVSGGVCSTQKRGRTREVSETALCTVHVSFLASLLASRTAVCSGLCTGQVALQPSIPACTRRVLCHWPHHQDGNSAQLPSWSPSLAARSPESRG